MTPCSSDPTLPSSPGIAQSSANDATSELQRLPDSRLRRSAATEIGLRLGSYLAGVRGHRHAPDRADEMAVGHADDSTGETTDMTDQHTKGAISKAQGKVEEGLGRLTGDKRRQVQGVARQVQGDAQGFLGDVQDAVSTFEWPTIDLASIDVGKAMAEAAAAAHVGRRSHRPRWPLAVGGLVVTVLTGLVILRSDALRARLARGASLIRERISGLRGNRADRLEIDLGDPIAFPAAQTAPSEPSPFRDNPTIDPIQYPAGLGSTNVDRIPDFEAAVIPA
jgi:uncharacterized protein YjbJ (UPF0337 family)